MKPNRHFENWQQDPQGNYLARLVFQEKTRELCIDVDLVAEMTVINPFDFFLEPSAEEAPFPYEDWLAKELKPFLEAVPPGPEFKAFLESIDPTPRRTVDFLVALNLRVHQDIGYLIRMEPGVQTCEETLSLKSGSCRDSAWLLVQVLRHMGLAARFVSGYLIQLVPDVKPLDGPEGASHDFTDLHAWTEVYLPGAGWVGLDPTSGLFAGEGHIPLACTPDPASAAPISGGVDPCEVEFDFEMTLTRIHEDPRVTKPYADEQWERIVKLGYHVDERLKLGDVRLTMGGEPTFVSIDDMEALEWTTAAVGPTKRLRATELIQRLYGYYAPGGLLHYGQGKWYPGEPLPRWALSCYWRTDGEPMWSNLDLIAEESRDYGFGAKEAEAFTKSLAERLGVGPKWVVPAYEDVWHYLAEERRLPVNFDAIKSDLKGPDERARVARILERGVNAVTGYLLPIRRQWWQAKAPWVSGPWPVRPENMFLLPGDSPLGLRLPLDSLPWVSDREYPHLHEVDPFQERPPLPTREELARQLSIEGSAEPFDPMAGSGRRQTQVVQDAGFPHRATAQGGPTGTTPEASKKASKVVRTALCVEPRDGKLYVFMPPAERLEDYLDLLTAVEQTSEELKLPVVIEGYEPPSDHRVKCIKVTPDPGVIEVNIHPGHNWDELVENSTVLYEEARLSRLGTEKFDLDGRHTGTGGGNHIVMGGATPADSPFLRRPDLLRSLVGFWNNHPSLSYLFSGTFIGPTSQAPRVDEGRQDAIHELQIAFNQIPEGSNCPPWLVDRAFRHLLVDLTGNTHRAEFCIDKLYSPDSPTGRLGLLEFRGFEMPPHVRMSLTQQLLLRALVAHFWEQPYHEKLVMWGTALHDRFMLPHYLMNDFRDVIDILRAAKLDLEFGWFLPHFEFRLPAIGQIERQDMVLELRQAIEPWYVLGEEPGGGGTARYVDSSLERLQVKINGMTDTRHVVTCNGRKVPLQPTGTVGEYVAGVRYRAWQPPSCLHPTIGVHTPLVFDLLDTWSGRSVGGCTYHVSHPGGLSYNTFPVNAYEAESRRASRFFKMGHTVGPVDVPSDEINREFPLTLDLRC